MSQNSAQRMEGHQDYVSKHNNGATNKVEFRSRPLSMNQESF